jgi:GWxTD domain-containing protein
MMGMRAVAFVLLIVLSLSASAEAAQSRFKDLTEEEASKLWVEEIAAYIMTKTEREVWDTLATSEDRVRFIDAFWKRRDPTPETPENEYQTEHYRRLSYVNRFFGAGRPGWRTDRGHLYILLGPPDVIDSDPMGFQMHQYPTEVWTYRRPPHPQLPPNLQFAFVDTHFTGEFELTFDLLKDSDATRMMEALIGENYHEASTLQEMNAYNFGRPGTMYFGDGALPELERLNELALVSQIPERQLQPLSETVRVRATFGGALLDAERQIDFFRASAGEICIPVTVRLPYANFTFLEKPDRYESRIDFFGRLLGPDGQEVHQFNRQELLNIPPDRIQALKDEFVLYQLIFYAPPGEYQLLLAVRDNASNTVRTSEETIRVPNLAQSLTLSSVVLADAIMKLEEPTPAAEKLPFRFGDFEAVPNFQRVFSPSGTLNIYLEAYNLALSNEGKNSVRLSYVFQRDGRRYREAPATYLYPTDQRQRVIMSSIPLTDFTPGDYTLLVSVTDDVVAQTVTAEVDLQIR